MVSKTCGHLSDVFNAPQIIPPTYGNKAMNFFPLVRNGVLYQSRIEKLKGP